MALDKEYREFFLRHSKVSSGSKPDQEVGFRVSYPVIIAGKLKTVFNRFLKGDFPEENIFRKLFESITFKLNVEDTATNTQQGLVEVATDTEFTNGTENNVAGFKLIPTIKQVKDYTDVSVVGDRNYSLENYVNDGETITASIDALDVQVGTNATNIATNASGIATNAANIATNAANIATNTSDISTLQTDMTEVKKLETFRRFKNDAVSGSTASAPGGAVIVNQTFDASNNHENLEVKACGNIENTTGSPESVIIQLEVNGLKTNFGGAQVFTIPANTSLPYCIIGYNTSYVAGQTVQLKSFAVAGVVLANNAVMSSSTPNLTF